MLNLSEALKRARENSPDLLQLDAQYRSAVQKVWLSVAPAEPTIAITDNDLIRVFHPDTAGSQQITFTQPIGFPGRAWLTRSQLRDQAEALRASRDAAALQLDANVKTAYVNLQLARDNMKLNAETARAFDRVLEISRRRYESGATAQTDVLDAQVALLQNENDLADLRAAEQAARAQLSVWLKAEPNVSFDVEALKMERHPKVDLGSAAKLMTENRSEIKAARATESAAAKSYKLAWASLLPDFQVTIGTTFYREPYGSPFSGDPAFGGGGSGDPSYPTRTYTIGLQFTIPLWFMFNERAVISGASADRAAAARAVDIQLNQAKIALESVVTTLEAAAEKIARFEERILPLTEQSFRLALIAYSSGRIDFQGLSEAANNQRQTRAAYHAAVVSYLTNYASYEQLVGGAVDEAH